MADRIANEQTGREAVLVNDYGMWRAMLMEHGVRQREVERNRRSWRRRGDCVRHAQVWVDGKEVSE